MVSRYLLVLFLVHFGLCRLSVFDDYHSSHLPVQLTLENDDDGTKNLLLPYNRTRVPGSKGSQWIQNFIIEHFNDTMMNDWTIELDNFSENNYNYTNLVFTLETTSMKKDDTTKYILFAAHYDTLVNPEGFIGAVDSAASCAILMYLAGFIDNFYYEDESSLDKIIQDGKYGIKFVFFDGEEAIEEWSDTDSIYGSRHLSNKWIEDGTISQIELFVLLDLIGAKRTENVPEWKIKSYYKESHKYYQTLSQCEDTYLADPTTPFTEKELHPSDVLFLMLNRILIEDDHVPFYKAQVPIMHVIPYPFPEHWHTLRDAFETLDEDEIRRWAVVLSDFAVHAVSG